MIGGAGAVEAPDTAVTEPVMKHGSFHIPYRLADDGIAGGLFVEYWTPTGVDRPTPVIMIHGGGMTGVTFLGTADGRAGWAELFARSGFSVFVIDQPGYGRSRVIGHLEETVARTVEQVVATHTASATEMLWPQAAAHSQWPGGGRPGDEGFAEYCASLEPTVLDVSGVEDILRVAGAELLERTGPAVLLGHSQGGRLAFALGDAAADDVIAIVAVEPNGPPVYDVKHLGAPVYFEDGLATRPWGVTCTPVVYDPPVASPSELRFVRDAVASEPGLVRGWRQADPPRRLVELSRIPVLMITGEASYHASYDHATAQYLRQAGVDVDFIRLQDIGIRGNGHIMMQEKNSAEIAQVICDWLDDHLHADNERGTSDA